MKLKKFAKIMICAFAAALLSAVSPAAVSADEYFYFDGDEFYFEYNVREEQSFSEDIKPELNGAFSGSGIYLNWNYIEGADGCRLYRYSDEKKKFMPIADLPAYENYYLDRDVSSMTKYVYRLRAYQKSDGGTVFSKSSASVTVSTGMIAPCADIAAKKNKVRISWKKDESADYYKVYRCRHKRTALKGYELSWTSGEIMNPRHSGSDGELACITEKTSLSFKKDENYDYYFRVVACRKDDGDEMTSDFSQYLSSSSARAYINGAKLSPSSTVPVVNYREDSSPWTMCVSNEDVKLLDEFAAEHFTEDMSVYDRLEYTAQYIHDAVDYAYDDDFAALEGVSYVKAVFEMHSGQCIQYNGALAAMAAHMGLDVRMVHGYRGYSADDRWSHFWCEINIDGKYYVMDAGNKKDGLYNFAVPYEFAGGYMYFDDPLTETPDVKQDQ